MAMVARASKAAMRRSEAMASGRQLGEVLVQTLGGAVRV